MKKKLLLFSLLFIFSLQIFAQVPQEQRSLLIKVSATWCPPCGGWAWDMFENLVEDNQDNAVLITAHYSGDLFNVSADEMAANVNAAFQPSFFLNNVHQSITSGNASTKRTTIKDAVDANALEMPLANVGINVTHIASTEELQFNTTTKFFQDATGEYYVASYIVENEVVNQQAGQGADAIHEKILRGSVTSETFGELVVNGAVATGAEVEHNNTITIDADWNIDHLEFVSIIWKKENDEYQFVNANITTDFTIGVGADDLNTLVSAMKVHPTVTSTTANVTIDLENEIQNATLELYDFSGKKVEVIFQGQIGIGNSTFTIEKSSGMTKGMYLVVLQTEAGAITRKVIFE